MEVIFYLLIPITYLAVIIAGIVMFIVDKVKARREGRERKAFFKYLFAIAVTWIATTFYAITSVLTIVHMRNNIYMAEALEIIFAAVFFLAFLVILVLFIIDAVKAKKEGRKIKNIFKYMLVSFLSVIIYITFSAAMLCLFVALSGADPFP